MARHEMTVQRSESRSPATRDTLMVCGCGEFSSGWLTYRDAEAAAAAHLRKMQRRNLWTQVAEAGRGDVR